MDRRTLLAIALSFLIFLGWQKFVLEKYQHQAAPTAEQSAVGSRQAQQAVSPATAATAPAIAPSREEIRLEHSVLSIGNGAKALEGWIYHNTSSPGDAEDLKGIMGELSQLDLSVDHADYAMMGTLSGTLSRSSEKSWQWIAENDAVRISREIEANTQAGYLDVTFRATFKKSLPKFSFVSLVAPLATGKGEARDRKLIYMAGNKVQTLAAEKSAELTDVLLPAQWVGFENRYFLLSVLDRAGQARALIQPLGADGNRLSLVYPVNGNTLTIPVRVYFGPKQGKLLSAVSPTLENAIDFGWLTPLAYVILRFMNWLFSFLKNYGLAIIILTTVLKILLYPLTYKSMKSMKQMAAIQPQLQRLREKYADDKEALNREMLTLMRTQGYNPMAGCLPMLVQMPVFFALYRVLYGSFELYRAPFAFWIGDLSSKDPMYVTPVLLTAVMYFQQKLTPNTATDPAQAKMMQWMPVIFGVFMVGLPAGLTLYMLTNAVVSIIQQVILNKKLGVTPAHVVAKAN